MITSMMLALESLRYKDISVIKTVNACMQNLMRMYQESGEKGYLLNAKDYIEAYMRMGFHYDSCKKNFDAVLNLLGTTKEEAFPKKYYFSKKIKLTPLDVRSMMGKWMPSKECPMKISEAVRDIMQKVKEQKKGVYFYGRKIEIQGKQVPRYELVIQDGDTYFCDKVKQQYYVFDR